MNNPKIIVAAAVIIRDNKVLLTQRVDNSSYTGLWEFPGGKQEFGETILEALVRECQEELGITVHPSNLILKQEFAYPEKLVELHFWRAEIVDGDPQSLEGQPFVWYSKEVLVGLQMLPANLQIKNLVLELI